LCRWLVAGFFGLSNFVISRKKEFRDEIQEMEEYETQIHKILLQEILRMKI